MDIQPDCTMLSLRENNTCIEGHLLTDLFYSPHAVKCMFNVFFLRLTDSMNNATWNCGTTVSYRYYKNNILFTFTLNFTYLDRSETNKHFVYI